MAGHGARLPSTVNGQSSDHGFVLPLSSHRLNGWRSIFTSLTPFVSQNSGRTLRVYARRLLTENNQPISIPPVGERHHSLGVWTSGNVHIGRGASNHLSSRDSENFSSSSSPDSENVVINIESNSARENQRRSRSPATLVLDSSDNMHPVEVHENVYDVSSESSNDNENPSGEVPQNENEQNISINGDSLTDLLERHPELRSFLKVVWHYCVFFLIIIAKLIYDRFASLFVIVLFFLGFIFSNKIIKLSISYHERRSKSALLLPSETTFSNLGELLWVVVITDLVLKLSTIFLKGICAMLPNCLLSYRYRGNLYATFEYTSQLYRSLAPVQPWLSYLMDNYTGVEKGFGVFLSALYMLCKGPRYYLQRYGSVPSKDELKDTGSLCPICQDDFVIPTMLQCKHIFCEQCVARWFDRERTCPMCRTKVADDPSYRDGSTSFAFQLY
ncbi:RING finger and transmembrane domain-containing protein 2 [Armadillidium nasatum]|uniref:RING finger and transmembrane domain-containing protein 2 n=1 Tax=Armadillidium nasatum TaxID=96803 RepID=A0A5N5TMM0_9CRUS|nr:RING finger and transmembrane domain-containing protein 2 [Armadillidium nasatum]